MMLKNIDVIRLKNKEDIFKSYEKAYSLRNNKSSILIEYADYYNEK